MLHANCACANSEGVIVQGACRFAASPAPTVNVPRIEHGAVRVLPNSATEPKVPVIVAFDDSPAASAKFVVSDPRIVTGAYRDCASCIAVVIVPLTDAGACSAEAKRVCAVSAP